MLSITMSKQAVSHDLLMAVHQFEGELTDFIRKALQRQEYVGLQVLPDFTLADRHEAAAEITHNATMSLGNSYDFIALVKKWISKYEELDCYPPNFTIIVTLEFKETQKKETAEDKKRDELPVFTTTKPRHSFDKIVLSVTVKKRIMATLSVIEKQDLVYHTWGFEEVDGIPRAVINFFGQPGTGKTMCAHAIAAHLQKPLLALNYSEIESKYVGDAPKNLKHAFDTATEMDAVLFFDEADSFLGKRIQNVSQGSDQALNSLRSQMLILLEEHEGVVIFATNLVSNFDKAFESRILDSIEIPLPDRKGRARLIQKMIPAKLPLAQPITGRQLFEASDIIDGLSGREIKNAMLKMLLNHSDTPDHRFTFDDIKEAMHAKMAEIAAIREEENRIVKQKIMKALAEKSEMLKAENEAKEKAEQQKAE